MHVQLTNDNIVADIYSAVLGMLTPVKDYVTAQNAAVVSVKALPDTSPFSLTQGDDDDDGGVSFGRRRLLWRSW